MGRLCAFEEERLDSGEDVLLVLASLKRGRLQLSPRFGFETFTEVRRYRNLCISYNTRERRIRGSTFQEGEAHGKQPTQMRENIYLLPRAFGGFTNGKDSDSFPTYAQSFLFLFIITACVRSAKSRLRTLNESARSTSASRSSLCSPSSSTQPEVVRSCWIFFFLLFF